MMRASFPDQSCVLMVGSPGIGLLEFNISLVKNYLEKGDVVIFVALDNSPDDVLKTMESFGMDTKQLLGHSLFFLDYNSSLLGASEERPVHTGGVRTINDLEGIMFNIGSIFEETKRSTRIFIYSLSTLFLYNQANVVLKFFQISNSKIRANYGTSIFSVHEGVHDERTVNHLMAIADGVVELRFDEDMNKMMRIRNMRGCSTSPQWVPFEIRNIDEGKPTRLLEWT
jgi:KaiC/GvpD/RAD55 family RecA-like ATPase